ncbi:hypothetical protein J7K91_00705 [bacterium]|nr:hypothetical protein [bacterium]
MMGEEVKKMYKEQYEICKKVLIQGGRKVREGMKDMISALKVFPLFLDDKEEGKDIIKKEIQRGIEKIENQDRELISFLVHFSMLLLMLAERKELGLPSDEIKFVREFIEI